MPLNPYQPTAYTAPARTSWVRLCVCVAVILLATFVVLCASFMLAVLCYMFAVRPPGTPLNAMFQLVFNILIWLAVGAGGISAIVTAVRKMKPPAARAS